MKVRCVGPCFFVFLEQVIDNYLDTLIFPETMEHRGLKLAANGQDVGGDMLFEVKLGFSGTPSDLLPLELGRWVVYAEARTVSEFGCLGLQGSVGYCSY